MKMLRRLLNTLHSSRRQSNANAKRHRKPRFDRLEDRRVLAIDGLIAHWSGDGTADDSAGTNHGILEGGATFTPGLIGQAFSLDGIDDRIRVPHSPGLNPAAGFTIEGWIRSDSTDGPRVIASKWNDNTSDWSYIFKDHNNNDKLRIELRSGSINSFADLAGNTSIVTGLWTHVAMTYDTNSVRLYYNGELDGTQQVDPAAVIHASTTDFLIGAVFTGGGISENFRGLIDEVSLYDRALGAAEIQSIIDTTAPLATATADSFTTPGGRKLHVPAPGVLANDTGALFAMLVAEPSHGTLQLHPSGSFVYTPSSGFVGQDSFSYRASASASSNIATVTIDVTVPPVSPDPAFGIDWKVTTDLGVGRSGDDVARAVAYQSDGKFVVLGETSGSGAVILRYNDDGSLDATFGTAGHVNTDIFVASFRGQSIDVDSADRIVVAGTVQGTVGNDFAVFRLNSNGFPDTAFSGDGEQTIDFGDTDDAGHSVAFDSAGRIVVGGFSGTNGAIARLNSNGDLDTTFSGDGKQIVDLGGPQIAYGVVAVDSENRVLFAGDDGFGSGSVVRLTVEGDWDATFSGDGKQELSFSANEDGNLAFSIAVDSADRVIVAGTSFEFLDCFCAWNYDFAVARLNTDGSLDTTFGVAGQQTIDFANADPSLFEGDLDIGFSVAVDSEDRIIVAGYSHSNLDTSVFAFAVVRLNVNGGLDTTFSGDGKQLIDFGSAADIGHGVAVDSAGRIILVGSSGADFALARLTDAGVLDTTFDGDGRLLTNIDFYPAEDVATDVAYQSDGKMIVLGLADYRSGVIARYNPDGSLDTSFGTAGKLILGPEPYFAIAVDSLDRIVLAADQALVRLNADGSWDMTFGEEGRQSTWGFISSSYGVAGLAVDSADRIMMSGSLGSSFGVARWNPDGSLDTSFGVDGRQAIEIVGGSNSVALDSAGRILISGAVYDSTLGWHFAIARLNTNGSVDTTFGAGGKQTLEFFNGFDSDLSWGPKRGFAQLAVDSDDRVVVAGATHQVATGYDFAVARLTSDGQLDGSFASGGWQAIDFGSQFDFANGVAIDYAGRIVVAGSAYQGAGDNFDFDWENDFAVVRLNGDGSFDTSFGQGVVDFSTYDIAVGVIIDNAGGIVIVGDSWSADSGIYDIALVRLFGDADGDGIEDSVDAQSAVFSDDFSDIDNGGATSGTIVTRGDQNLIVVDAHNPAHGFLISADPAGGATPAAIEVEGSTLYLDAGESIIVTHGSVDLQILTGPVAAELHNAYGDLVAVVNLPSGSGGLFDPEAATLTITGTSGDDVFALTSTGATLNGSTITATSGLSLLSLNGGGGSDQFTLEGTPPAAFEVQGGDPIDRLTVTSTSDSVDVTDTVITLREAIIFANASSGPDTILFEIPTSDPSYNAASGTFTISPTSSLPAITDAVTIDGYSQSGSVASNAGAGQGLNAVLKIEINGSELGSIFSGSTGLEVAGGAGSAIQGLAISGFTFGITLRGPSTGTVITGSFIGTDAAGTAAQKNAVGVALISFPQITSGNRIEGNLISGNELYGIIAGSQTTAHLPVTGTQIFGNYVGTKATGSEPLANGTGVALNSTENSQVGGTGAGQANVIAFNSSAGVSIGSANGGYIGHSNTVRGNSIYGNAALGVDLNMDGPDGVTQYNGSDHASFTNRYQDFPQIIAALTNDSTRIQASLHSAANATFTLDFYASAAADPTGYGEGQRWLGSTNVSTDSNGNWIDMVTVGASLPGEYITASATDAAGNSSEFSAAVASMHWDLDGDGIENWIDTQPTTFSNDFSDVANGGGTTGTITRRGDQIMTIVDAPESNHGLIVATSPAGGSTTAEIRVDSGDGLGQGQYTFGPGTLFNTTTGSVITQILNGTVEVAFIVFDGQAESVVATASLSAGTQLIFEPQTVTFVAAIDSQPVEIILVGANGQEATATLSADNQITFEPQSFTFSTPVTNTETVQVIVDGAPISVTPGNTVQPVQIDIRPEDSSNTLNLASNGVIAVAILSTADFDARDVLASSVIFAGAFASHHALQDVNGDGRLDMVLHFRTQDTNLRDLYEQLLIDDLNNDGVLDSTQQTASVSLSGETVDEVLIEGFDDLNLFLAGKKLRDLLEELFV